MRILTSEVFLGHHLPGHAECPERLIPLLREQPMAPPLCSGTWLQDSVTRGGAQSAEQFFESALATSHDRGVFDRVRALLAEGGQLDADTYVCPDSLKVSLEAVACSFAAAELVLQPNPSPAMALVRPPGHHATRDTSMGFCLFNTIAALAKRLQQHEQLGRLLIIDFDVHHGNGSQDIFYDDDSVFFYSIHRSPFYPGTGDADETGTGRGLGFTLNTPLEARTEPEQFLAAFRHGVERAVAASKPEMILVSAGFDAHRDDPVGGLGLASKDYEQVGRIVREAAALHSGGRVVSLLEGGYNPTRLAESISSYAQGLSI